MESSFLVVRCITNSHREYSAMEAEAATMVLGSDADLLRELPMIKKDADTTTTIPVDLRHGASRFP